MAETTADQSRNGRVFRPDSPSRTDLVGNSAVFLAALVAFSFSTWAGLSDELRSGFLLLAALWGFFTAATLWSLLAHHKERLRLSDTRFSKSGIIRSQEVDLGSVQHLRWYWTSSQILVKSPTDTITVWLPKFLPEDGLKIVEFMRCRVPHELQQNWELFCLKVAVPLRQKVEAGDKPAEYEVRVTRKKWVWYFAPTTLAFLGIGMAGAIVSKSVVWFWPLAVVVPVWIFTHFGTPKNGMVQKRIPSDPALARFLTFALLWLIIGVALIVAVTVADLPQTVAGILVVVGFLAWLVVLSILGWRFDRDRKLRESVLAGEAVRQWDEGCGNHA